MVKTRSVEYLYNYTINGKKYLGTCYAFLLNGRQVDFQLDSAYLVIYDPKWPKRSVIRL